MKEAKKGQYPNKCVSNVVQPIQHLFVCPKQSKNQIENSLASDRNCYSQVVLGRSYIILVIAKRCYFGMVGDE